jgi:hypothetical protein
MQKTIVTLVDDLTGKEFEDGETIEFGFEGKQYEVDLAKANAERFRKQLQKYAEAGRKVRTHRVTRSTVSGAHKGRTSEIRNWAVMHGFEIGTKGRIPGQIQEAYDKAHA